MTLVLWWFVYIALPASVAVSVVVALFSMASLLLVWVNEAGDR